MGPTDELAASVAGAGTVIASTHLLFLSPFLMFLSPLDLFAQATQQGNGWTLVKTTATTLDQQQTTP
jgi:hypothetical protein